MSAGFRGRIFRTPATKELCSLVLPDSALPLYTSADAARITSEKQWPVHIAAHQERVEIPA